MKKDKQAVEDPSWEKVLRLAWFFQLIEEATENKGRVNMMWGWVNRDVINEECEDNLCGTPACHAGWFGIFYDNDCGARFASYAREMADSLGFNTVDDLEDWAQNNPEIWGNMYGGQMFSNATAFYEGATYQHPTKIKTIADHWMRVAARLHEKQTRIL